MHLFRPQPLPCSAESVDFLRGFSQPGAHNMSVYVWCTGGPHTFLALEQIHFGWLQPCFSPFNHTFGPSLG